jgi:pimeloyl-ACP methyl ester carboxylesterase
MAEDVAGFIDEHKLHNTTLIGHSMGAKTAMTLALQSPDLIDNIVSVDNAPIDAALLSSFGKYVQGMKRIEEAGVTKQAEADAILKDYEEVSSQQHHVILEMPDVLYKVLTNSPISAGKSTPACGREDTKVQGSSPDSRSRLG